MSIQSELEKISAYGQHLSPANEADTCNWIIMPLLEACGYAKHEIRAQNPDGAGKFPDFSILWNTEHQWFLEAKSWNVKLSDDHVNQAIYSAYSTGRRWVVLSNGKEWRLYDARIHAPKPADRLVSSAEIADAEGIVRFLTAISKESMTSDKIESFAEETKLRTVLASQLADSNSTFLKKMVDVLRKDLNVPGVSAASLQAILTVGGEPRPALVYKSDPTPQPPISVVKESRTATTDTIHLITPVKDEDGFKVAEILEMLLGNGWWVFGDRTPYRKALKPGDKVAFYHSGVGVVAEAIVATALELGEVPGVRNPKRYPWRFRVREVRYFFDRPVRLNDARFRAKLDGFRDKTDSTNWSWFVQGTQRVTEHDFRILVGQG